MTVKKQLCKVSCFVFGQYKRGGFWEALQHPALVPSTHPDSSVQLLDLFIGIFQICIFICVRISHVYIHTCV